MDLKDIAAVSGKPGLFKILKPTRTGVILESIDAARNKVIINTNSKVSILKDISVYTNGVETNMPLSEILVNIKAQFSGALPLTNKSSDQELKSFFLKVVPEYDTDRVYLSDIKKIVLWYQILETNFPELLTKQDEVPENSKEIKEEEVKTLESDAKAEKVQEGKKKASTKETAEAEVISSATLEETKPKKVVKPKAVQGQEDVKKEAKPKKDK